MAKRKFTRPKVVEPKLIEVDGHLLTEKMHGDYKGRIVLGNPRPNEEPSATATRVVDDVLYPHRPSVMAEGQLFDIFQRLAGLMLAVGSMRQYPFPNSASPEVRASGCRHLNDLALALYYESAKLTAIASAIESERGTKLQDWRAQRARIEQIGPVREKEVSRG